MSERGSFTTEYIYCKKCYEIVLDALTKADTTVFPSLGLPIVAGKAHGMWDREEIFNMEEVASDISKDICHPVTIAVLSDGGPNVFITAKPQGEMDTDE